MIHSELNNIYALILDMDGVLWHGDQPIGNLKAVFENIKELGVKVILATNNATLTIDRYLQKLSNFGVVLNSWQVVNSSVATADYLKNHYEKGSPVYIIGEEGLIKTLEESGFSYSENQAVAVVVGLDVPVQPRRRAPVAWVHLAAARTFPWQVGLGRQRPALEFPRPRGAQMAVPGHVARHVVNALDRSKAEKHLGIFSSSPGRESLDHRVACAEHSRSSVRPTAHTSRRLSHSWLNRQTCI